MTLHADDATMALLLNELHTHSNDYSYVHANLPEFQAHNSPAACPQWDEFSDRDKARFLFPYTGGHVSCDPNAEEPYEGIPRAAVAKTSVSKKTAAPNSAPKPAHVPTAPSTTSVVSNSQVLSYLASTGANPNTNQLWNVLAPRVSALTSRQLVVSLQDMITKLSGLKLDDPLGAVGTATADQYVKWRQSFRRDLISVGPLILNKLLQQLGVAWQAFDIVVSDVPGDSISAVEYSRAGYTLFITNRHEVTIVSDDTEHTGDDRITAINEAIEGLVINKQEGKFLGFHDIPPAAYELAASFCTVYVVEAGKGKIHTCSFKPNGPLVDGALALYFDTKLRPQVLSSQPLYSAPDYVHDYIAYCVWRSAGDRLGTLAALLDKRTLLEADRALNTTDKLVVTNKVRAMEKLQLVMNTLKLPASADSAVTALDKARGSRNRTLVTQFIQKNVGGILAGDLMPSVETVRKAHSIVQFLRSNYPAGFEDGKEWNLYGVAYNHMARALDPVVKGKLRFFDVQKATNSLARFETRSILAAEGCDVLVDDSYADRAIDSAEMTSADIGIVMRFDQAKMVVLSRLVNSGEVGIVVMKVNLSAFTTVYLEATNAILFPEGKAVCRHVRLYKFGKLHNAEVFLVLSNATTLSQNNLKAPREIF